MTDIEMTKACAAAMGLELLIAEGVLYAIISDKPPAWSKLISGTSAEIYDPLTNDAQAMALVKRFYIVIERDRHRLFGVTLLPERVMGKHMPTQVVRETDDLNRGIVECVAKMHAAAFAANSLQEKT